MARPVELLREGKKEEIWQMCCGFIYLSLEEFMAIQNRLLLEEIELLKNSELGRRVMHGAMPKTVEEFREQVPLTYLIPITCLSLWKKEKMYCRPGLP